MEELQYQYFTYHWFYGFKGHKTEEEAIAMADELLEQETRAINDCSEEIYWGIIKQQAKILPTGESYSHEGNTGELMIYEFVPECIE